MMHSKRRCAGPHLNHDPSNRTDIMKTIHRRGLHTGFALALIATSAHGQALPDPRAVLAKYVQATNAAKLATIPGQRMKGTFEMPAQGLSGQVEGYRDRTGRSLQVIT